MLKPKLFSIIKHRNKELPRQQLITDIISGIIVAIIALPLSVALAIASGVSPEKGLITAIVAGFFISFLGGSRVQIGGPTGAFVVIVYGIVQKYGVQGLTIATIMAGMLMILFGLIKLGTIIKYVPYPTTTGFTSGIAIVLMSTQIKDFFGLQTGEVPSEFIGKWKVYIAHFDTINWMTLLVGAVSLLIIIYWPKINKTIPGSLIALIVSTLAVKFLNLDVETIGSRFGTISNTIQFINFSDFNLNFTMVQDLFQPAITIALLASIEALLSAVVSDGMIGKKHNSNMELIAEGVANIASGLLGGIPATGAIARTAANVKNGGRTPIAGIVHSLVLLLIMIVLMPLAKLIPMTTLAAILIRVAYNMSEWHAFKDLLKSTKSDVTVLLVTFFMTVFFDLVIAIELGMLIAMFLFVKRMADSTLIANVSPMYKGVFSEPDDEDFDTDGAASDTHLDSKIFLYEINGPLFFGAANRFIDVMNELNSQSKVIIFKLTNVPSIDATALDALKRIFTRCNEKDIRLIFTELNEQPLKLLTNSGYINLVGEENFIETVKEAVSTSNAYINSLVE